jgi:CDP-diacylglycerol--glycerol-3-phosphate 3-phosphatidyltransferase
VVLIIIGALFNRMAAALWVTAVLSNLTVIHRMIYTYQQCQRMGDAQPTQEALLVQGSKG